MPRIVGLTGGIASGKSTVSRIWSDYNHVAIVDADKIARDVVAPGTLGLWLLRRQFGDTILLPSGELDRAKLGRLVFNDREQRGKLNRITHPLIISNMIWQLVRAAILQKSVIILDTPLLYESKTLIPVCRQIVVVYCTPEQQLSRMLKRNPELSETEAKQRIDSQIPLSEKAQRADIVLDNTAEGLGELKRTSKEVLTDRLTPSPASEWIWFRGPCLFIALCGIIYFLRIMARFR